MRDISDNRSGAAGIARRQDRERLRRPALGRKVLFLTDFYIFWRICGHGRVTASERWVSDIPLPAKTPGQVKEVVWKSVALILGVPVRVSCSFYRLHARTQRLPADLMFWSLVELSLNRKRKLILHLSSQMFSRKGIMLKSFLNCA